MKRKTSRIATTALAVALLAGPGLAQTPSQQSAPPAQPAPAVPPQPAPAVKAAPSARLAAAGSSHKMEGEVTKVDAKKGWVDVKTPEGRLKLHYPPPALDSVKAGDLVTVEIGLRATK